MAILDAMVPPKPPTELEIKQAAFKARLVLNIVRLFEGMIDGYTINFGLLFDNPEGLTPQEAFDAIGTDGADLLRLAEILRRTLNEALPNALGKIELPARLVVNEDGTVRVEALTNPNG